MAIVMMYRRTMSVLAMAAAAACSASPTALEQAERRYDYLKANGGSVADLCAAAEAAKSAAVDDGAAQVTFIRWKSAADLHCQYGRQ